MASNRRPHRTKSHTALAGLILVGFMRSVPAANERERTLVERVDRMSAAELIPGSSKPRRHMQVPLRGTLQDYVARVVSDPRVAAKNVTTTGFVPCSRHGSHVCVAVVGDPCPKRRRASSEDCEGMYLTVVVDTSTAPFTRDLIVGGGYYVSMSQDDIEELLAAAP